MILCAIVVDISERKLIAVVAIRSNTPQQRQALRVGVGQIA
jgi:hypothetical protein